MGKYTSLARKAEQADPQQKGQGVQNTNKHSIELDISSNPVAPHAHTDAPALTPLRPYAVNAVVRCIHNTTPDKCAVCNGYVRWLSADERRISRALRDPDRVRREFWREVKGGAS